MEHRICSNCNGAIALPNFLIHEAYCTRSLVKCPVCNELIRRTTLDEHLAKAHATVHCELCSEPYDKCDEATHKGRCSMRPVNCEFCDLVLPAPAMPEHHSQCGCRTELCPLCKKFVMIRELNNHTCSSLRSTNSIQPDSNERHTDPNLYLDSDFDVALQLQCLELDNVASSTGAAMATNSVPTNTASFSRANDSLDNESKSFAFHQTIGSPSSCASTEVIIPCEFCNGSYQISQISVHQAQCCRFSTQAHLTGPSGSPSTSTEQGTASPEPLVPNQCASGKSVTKQNRPVTNSGDAAKSQLPVCLSRPGKLSELRPLAAPSRHTFNGLGEGTSDHLNRTRSIPTVRHSAIHATYNLPPVKDPRAHNRKLSAPKNCSIRTPPACMSSDVPKITTRPKRRSSQACNSGSTRTSTVHPVCTDRPGHLSASVSTTQPPRQSFPGLGRRLGDH